MLIELICRFIYCEESSRSALDSWGNGKGPNARAFDKIVQDVHLCPRKQSLTSIKKAYFNRYLRKAKDRFPRLRAHTAEKSRRKSKRISAYLFWRFPLLMRDDEMTSVYAWLKKRREKLKMSVDESFGGFL